MNDKDLFVSRMCRLLADVEKETHKELGNRAYLFVNIWEDCITISQAIREAYPPPSEPANLVNFFFHGLIHELYWFNFLFLSGKYAVIHARMRFCWEAIYRSFYVETYKGGDAPGSSPEEKLDWLDKKRPDWNQLRPILEELFPPAKIDPAKAFYNKLWKDLHQFVHPSAEVTYRSIDESALNVRDGFDKKWALDTLATAEHVFDVIWVAVLSHYPKAAVAVEASGLRVTYPIVSNTLSHMYEP